MKKEVKIQAKAGVSVDLAWRTLTKDLQFLLPKLAPGLVKDVALEGDGGVGSVYLFDFKLDLPVPYQKQKVTEFDESIHRITVELVEGMYLSLGFSLYRTTFQLTPAGEQEIVVDVTIEYECDNPEMEAKIMADKESSVQFQIKFMENYLLTNA